jgi:hypothetical protein
MSKSDLRAGPNFHRTDDAICAYVLLCFMALMMGKYLEIKHACHYDDSAMRSGRSMWPLSETNGPGA